jgi:hypothetical protein
MNRFLNINNRQQIKSLLLSLKADTVPLWGKMRSQQMVEHLIDQVQYTNGTKVPTCDVPEEEAYKRKRRGIYTDAEIPKNVVLGSLPEDLEYESMEAAINQLMAELEAFDHYFKEPGRTVLHGGFGPMNYHEWQIWHGKHFTHHFKQFGLF